jgi:ribosomal protein S7
VKNATSSRSPKREIFLIPIWDVDLKFMNVIMQSGKKAVAERIIYSAPDFIEKRTGQRPVKPSTWPSATSSPWLK